MTAKALRLAGAGLVFLTGLIAALFGVWFILSDQPFDAEGFADEFGMTRDEVTAANPRITSWVMHVQDQIGSLSLGWGALVMTLAATGLRHGVPWARWALWIGALPTLVYSAFSEIVEFGTVDVGSLSSMIALALFAIGMGLSHVGAKDAAPDATAPA